MYPKSIVSSLLSLTSTIYVKVPNHIAVIMDGQSNDKCMFKKRSVNILCVSGNRRFGKKNCSDAIQVTYKDNLQLLVHLFFL